MVKLDTFEEVHSCVAKADYRPFRYVRNTPPHLVGWWAGWVVVVGLVWVGWLVGWLAG